MRDPKRIPLILDELKGIWASFPDLRLGQLIGNLMLAEEELYYVDDEQFIKLIRDHYSEVKYIEPNKPNIQD